MKSHKKEENRREQGIGAFSEMGNDAKVAIIILNWNGFHDTVECLESLRGLDYYNFKIVLVDNGSDNNEGNRLKEMFPEIHLIKNRTNRGFAGGNNDGIKWSKENGFKYVWILNNDTVVEKDSLKCQISTFKQKRTGAVGSKIRIYGTGLIWSKGIYLIKFSVLPMMLKFFSNIDEGKRDNKQESTRAVKYVSGCSILLKTSLKNSLFDEGYFAYCEDMDLCRRIREEGYTILYEPRSVVYHKILRDHKGKKFSRFSAYYSYRNKLIFLNDIYPKYILVLALAIYFACFIRDFLRIALFYDNKKALFAAMLNGFGDGLKHII